MADALRGEARNNVRTRTTRAIAGLMISIIGLAMQPSAASAAPQFACSIKPDIAHNSVRTDTHIVGKAKLGCDRAITSLTYTVRLQRKNTSGTWVTLNTNQGTLYGSNTYAPVSRPIVRQATAPCQLGQFRTAAQINNATWGSQVRAGSVGYSRVETDPCVVGGGGGGGGSW
jgi:hypothetical protein